MSYSEGSSLNPHLVEISFLDVLKGDSVVYESKWYKALEDSYTNDGYVGFAAEDEDFKRRIIQVKKNDMGYNSRLLTNPTPVVTDPVDEETES